MGHPANESGSAWNKKNKQNPQKNTNVIKLKHTTVLFNEL